MSYRIRRVLCCLLPTALYRKTCKRWVVLHIDGEDQASWTFRLTDESGTTWAQMKITAMPEQVFDIGDVQVLDRDGPDSRFGRDIYQTVIHTSLRLGIPLRSILKRRSGRAEYAQHRLWVDRGVRWDVEPGTGDRFFNRSGCPPWPLAEASLRLAEGANIVWKKAGGKGQMVSRIQ